MALLWLFTVLTVSAMSLVFWLMSPEDPFFEASTLLQVGAGFALGLSPSRLMDTTLTPDALVHRRLRRRVVPWTSVRQVTSESFLRGRSVVIHEYSGRRTRLHAPVTGLMFWDRDFEAKYRTIGEWFMAHRGQE